MTKEEALKQIEELKKFIEDCDKKVGFENDEIFLLSAEEYEHYEDKIPLYQKIPERMGGGEKMTKDKYRWHDLRKNPDDLPEVNPNNDNEKDVLLLVQDKNKPEKGANWYIGRLKSAEPYSTCDKSGKTNFWGMPSYDCNWTIWGWSYFFEPEVLAWKEMEPFEKEATK